MELFNFLIGEFNVAALIYVHFPEKLRAIIHKSINESLKPCRILICEFYDKKQINNDSGGPKEVSMLYSIDDLLKDLSEMKIKEATKAIINLDEG